MRAVTTVLGLCAAISACATDEVTLTELNPFLGTWYVTEVDGAAASPGAWTFSDDRIDIDYSASAGVSLTATYTFDPAFSRVDIMLPGEPLNQAIYQFLGVDELAIKVMDGAADVATHFMVESGYDVLRMSRRLPL